VLDREQVLGMSEIRRHGSPIQPGDEKGWLMAEEREKINPAKADGLTFVMPGLDPGIHQFSGERWIAGSSPAMTTWRAVWALDAPHRGASTLTI
jgi:hypothetical protein